MIILISKISKMLRNITAENFQMIILIEWQYFRLTELARITQSVRIL